MEMLSETMFVGGAEKVKKLMSKGVTEPQPVTPTIDPEKEEETTDKEEHSPTTNELPKYESEAHRAIESIFRRTAKEEHDFSEVRVHETPVEEYINKVATLIKILENFISVNGETDIEEILIKCIEDKQKENPKFNKDPENKDLIDSIISVQNLIKTKALDSIQKSFTNLQTNYMSKEKK